MVEILSFLFVVFFVVGLFYINTKLDRAIEARMGTPLERGEVAFPSFARTQDPEGTLHAELADLLALRPDLKNTFAQGGLTGGGNVVGAGERWRWAACRQRNVYASAPMACPTAKRTSGSKASSTCWTKAKGTFSLV